MTLGRFYLIRFQRFPQNIFEDLENPSKKIICKTNTSLIPHEQTETVGDQISQTRVYVSTRRSAISENFPIPPPDHIGTRWTSAGGTDRIISDVYVKIR